MRKTAIGIPWRPFAWSPDLREHFAFAPSQVRDQAVLRCDALRRAGLLASYQMAPNANIWRSRSSWSIAAAALALTAASAAAPGGGSAAHAQVRVNLPEVRASLESLGPGQTVRRLQAAGQWDVVLAGIAKGEVAWIAIVPSLALGTDAGLSESLGISLAQALPDAPAAVLNALDPKDGPVLGPSRVCGAPFIEPTPEFLAAYRSRALAAVEGVRDPRLHRAREACLAALRKGQEPIAPGSSRR